MKIDIKYIWAFIIATVVSVSVASISAADQPFTKAYVDRDEPQHEFEARMADVEKAVAGFSKVERAQALAIAEGESRFAKYVLHDCTSKPKDAAGNCDHGKSRTYWQLQDSACPELRGVQVGSTESVMVGAKCALRRYKTALAYCKGNVEQAFAQYGGRACSATTASTAYKYRAYMRYLQ